MPLEGLYEWERELVATPGVVLHTFVWTGSRVGIARYDAAKLTEVFDAFATLETCADATPFRPLTATTRVSHGTVLKFRTVSEADGTVDSQWEVNLYGYVLSATAEEVCVEHSVRDDVLWRLPRRVLVGRSDAPCPACARKQVHEPRQCGVCGGDVPFPVVYACRDIQPGEELLATYTEEPPAEYARGADCVPPHAYSPAWDAFP